jgi:hypothetical protein
MTTVNQLIARLQELADCGQGELDVMFSYNYGDHWRTQVAVDVNAWPETAFVEHSSYHSMDKVIDNAADADPEDQELNEQGEVIQAGRQVIML